MATESKSRSMKPPGLQSRGTASTQLMPGSLVSPPYNSCAWYEKENLSRAQAALHMSNENLACRLAKLKVNAGRLQRELFLLQRHIKEFQCPLFETYEADILTRLIDVVHAHQDKKMMGGTAISSESIAEREIISRAYINASKQVQEETIEKLGLSSQHYQAIRRYEEQVAAYRSPNPFQTEAPFARWLLEKKDILPGKYAFWSKLYPICYGRSVEQSSTIL
ncbi:uncharacterized protein N7458_001989 [Penicillium daleae]|uniref:Uncharacterized protein n=1 Tax=Penicillium daleae TaxID=63821 RepID=A0AAD6CC73_9EURO|nr:uncharacterized protein N7458_001989 [Penicillium daleae]KAJ5460437.1 hypothetical protein N7458_001989 [Penicillium daleae]